MFTQTNRELAVATPLGENKLNLHRFRGREELSRPFEYEIEMLSEDEAIDPAEIIGLPVTFSLRQPGEAAYHFNGIVRRFGYCGQTEQETTYRATVVPWLWLLTQTSDCRIFQGKTTPQIIEQIFRDLGFDDFRMSLRGMYVEREYCVQYRESDFDFVSRLMEEEGIFYFFRHGQESHTLVLCDGPSAYFDLPEKEVEYADPDGTGDLRDQIMQWQHHYAFRPGRWAQTDYNFKTPGTSLMSRERSLVELPGNGNFEIYDYPGRFEDRAAGRSLTRIRMEEYEVPHDTVTGAGTYRSFSPGGTFTVATHRTSAEVGKSYVVTAVEISASVNGSYVTGSGDDEPAYENRFACIPAHVPFRPARITGKPIVEGPQTAVVVGPPGEEIYPDEHGRVKCQFHWDREGAYNEDSSCWIRVSQVHAGKGWGGMDLPRIGEEVIVDFLEGDPDRPIITGRVYNASQMPPFALPAEKTRSGMKSQTHQGAGYNEISMDDTAGQEQIRMNAQYNMDTAVGNNQSLIVNVDRSAKIGNNDALNVGNDSAESVGNNKSVKVGNNMNVDVGSKLVFNAGSSITLKCGASKIHMTSGGMITITGTIITTAAAANASVVAPLTQIVGGAMLTTVGGINMMNGAVCHVGAGLASIAGGKVDVAAAGTTSIKGGLITLN